MIERVAARIGPVTVVLIALAAPYAAAAEPPVAADPYATRKVFYEEHWRRKIESALSYVPGAVVAVNVELSPVVERTEATTQVGQNAVTRVKLESSAKDTSNQVAEHAAEAAESGGNLAKASTQDKSYSEYAVPETRVETRIAGLVPQRVAASISVPSSYYRAVWKSRNAAVSKTEDAGPSGEELLTIEEEMQAKIESIVVPLLPRREGEDEYRNVQVTSFEDLDTDNGETAPTPVVLNQLSLNDILTVRLRRDGETKLSQRLPDEVAVRIVGIHPDGNLMLSGKTTHTDSRGRYTVKLTGVVVPNMIEPDRSVGADAVADLQVKTREYPPE